MRRKAQCYLCKRCGHQFTNAQGRRCEDDLKMTVSLNLVGLSMRTIAKIFDVNASTISRWIREYRRRYGALPEGKPPVGPEEMLKFVRSKKTVGRTKKRIIIQSIKWDNPFGRSE